MLCLGLLALGDGDGVETNIDRKLALVRWGKIREGGPSHPPWASVLFRSPRFPPILLPPTVLLADSLSRSQWRLEAYACFLSSSLRRSALVLA